MDLIISKNLFTPTPRTVSIKNINPEILPASANPIAPIRFIKIIEIVTLMISVNVAILAAFVCSLFAYKKRAKSFAMP